MNARKWLTVLGFATLAFALLLPDETASAVVILLCVGAALVILWRNLPALSDLEPDHPKVGVLRQVTVMTVVLLAFFIGLAWMVETGRFSLSEDQSKWLLAALFGGIILVFGNLAPKLPHTRHTGLRLPWTIRDEQTWLVAHRILGWLSLPFGLLALAAAAIPDTDLSVKVTLSVLLGWIAIPSVLSLLFYLKKFGKL